MKYKFLLTIVLLAFFSFCSIKSIHAIKDSAIMYDEYETYDDSTVSCGAKNGHATPLIDDIPESIPRVTHIVYLSILIAVPIVIIVVGMLDLFKGITAQKEEDIKKGQQLLLKRLVVAGIIFFQ